MYNTNLFLSHICMYFHLHTEKSSYGNIKPSINFSLPTRMDPVDLQITSNLDRLLSCLDDEAFYKKRNDCENIHTSRESDITLEELFGKAKEEAEDAYIEKHGNRVTLLGHAGIGKTILARKMLKLMCDGRPDNNVKYIFFIHGEKLNELNNDKELTFIQFVLSAGGCDAKWMEMQNYQHDLATDTSLFNRICKESANVVFIIDGLDKVESDKLSGNDSVSSVKMSPKNFLCKILSGELLPHAKKFVTCRPREYFELQKQFRIGLHVEIIGLDEEQRDKLCEQICGYNYAKVKKYLEEHPDVLASCYVPVKCHIISSVLSKTINESGDVDSLTSLFVKVLSYYVGSSHVETHIDEVYWKLTDLGLNGIKNSQCIFNKNEIFKVSTQAIGTFLVTFVENICNDISPKCHFPHLVWQELFASIHLMLVMPERDFMERLKNILEKNWEVVAIFMFGLFNREVCRKLTQVLDLRDHHWEEKKTILTQHLLDLLPSASQDSHKLLQLCSLIHEADSDELNGEVLDEMPTNIAINHVTIQPTDASNISYILQKSNQSFELTFKDVEFSNNSFKEFCKGLSACKLKIKKLTISGNNIGNDGAKHLATCLHNIEELDVSKCGITDVGEIAKKLKEIDQPLKKLDLSYNPIGRFGAAELAGCLDKVEVLDVSYCGIAQVGVENIKSELERQADQQIHQTRVVGLEQKLTENKRELTKHLLDLLPSASQDSHKLLQLCYLIHEADSDELNREVLDEMPTNIAINDVTIHPTDASNISYVLQKSNQSFELTFKDVTFSNNSFKEFCKGLSACKLKMKKLTIRGNNIGDDGAKHLATCLHNIEELDVSKCGITDVGEIAKKLKEINQPLKTLDLSYNTIGRNGAAELAGCLDKVEVLDVSYCGITEVGIENIKNELKRQADQQIHQSRVVGLERQELID